MRASLWLESEGLLEEAVEHALAGKDLERAADLILKVADGIWDRGQQHMLLRWLKRLPPVMLQPRPRLHIYIARALAMNGKLQEAEGELEKIIRTLEEPHKKNSPGSEAKDLLGRALSVRAFVEAYRGNIEGMIRYSRKALDRLSEKNIMWRGSAA